MQRSARSPGITFTLAMASQLQSDAARTNGARSQGPATPEGKSTSSLNAMRHGLSAKRVVIPGESLADYHTLLDAYIEEFRPQSALEAELVHALAASRWRLRRLTAIESSLFEMELIRRRKDIDAQFTETVIEDRLAFVFQKLADNSRSPSLLIRYEGSLNRAHDRAFKQLLELQSRRKRQPELTPPPAEHPQPECLPKQSESSPPAESNPPTDLSLPESLSLELDTPPPLT